MNITITARKTSVRDSFKERIAKKLSKLDRFFDENANAAVTVTNEGIGKRLRLRLNHRECFIVPKKQQKIVLIPWKLW